MDVLREGNRGYQAKLLQRLLNKKRASPPLREDGVFGAKTRAAVFSFQARERIPQDGVAGSITWTRLGVTVDITHRVRLFPQPTGATCWSAAATMILGDRSVGPGGATLEGGGINLANPANIAAFARSLGWTLHHPQSWQVHSLAAMMRQKPLFAVGGGTIQGTGQNWSHAIVLSAMWSDGAPDGSGTMLKIYDPWPPNVGSIYARFYQGTVDGFDFLTRYILEP